MSFFIFSILIHCLSSGFKYLLELFQKSLDECFTLPLPLWSLLHTVPEDSSKSKSSSFSLSEISLIFIHMQQAPWHDLLSPPWSVPCLPLYSHSLPLDPLYSVLWLHRKTYNSLNTAYYFISLGFAYVFILPGMPSFLYLENIIIFQA